MLSLLLNACSAGTEATQEAETTAPTTIPQLQAFTDPPGQLTKTETVYAHLGADGALADSLVTDWLHTDKAGVRVEDVSSLTDITDMKGNHIPLPEGDALVWHMDETDLYYSGTTQKALPLAFHIQYTLDGEEITPQDLAGKSGSLRMEIQMENTDRRKLELDGESTLLSPPILAVGTLTFPHEVFSQVSLDTGTLISDGSREIGLFFGIPGLAQSLGINAADISDESTVSLPLAESVTITAQVTDFRMGGIMMAGLPLAALSGTSGGASADGSLNGITGLLQSLQKPLEALNKDGTLLKLLADPSQFTGMLSTMRQAISLWESNRALLTAAGKHLTAENAQALGDLLAQLDADKTAKLLEAVGNPVVKALYPDMASLFSALEAAAPFLTELMTELDKPEMRKAVENLPQTLKTLANLNSSLSKYDQLLKAIAAMPEMNFSLKQTDADTLTELLGDAPGLVARLTEWLRLGASYRIFTDVPEGAASSVLFIFEVAAVG
jgi:hypothetical protein